MVVSYANKIALEMFKLKCMSFEYIMKSRGLSIDLCNNLYSRHIDIGHLNSC